MVSRPIEKSIVVEPNQAIALPRRRRQTICALDAALWLSQEGSSADIVLHAGQCAVLNGCGLIVAQALGQRATLRLCTPPPASRLARSAERLAKSWRRTLAGIAQAWTLPA